MSKKHWSTVVIALIAAIAGVGLGAYFGPNAGGRGKVAQGPTHFFTNFNPQQYLDAATEGKVSWKRLEDEPVTGEHYGNPPHSRAYVRRTVRFAATITMKQWQALKESDPSITGEVPVSNVCYRIFSNQGDDVERHGEDKGGGEFRLWRIPADSTDNETISRHGFGWRYYGGTRGVGSHHGLFTFRVVQVGDHVEVAFFIWESWPRNR